MQLLVILSFVLIILVRGENLYNKTRRFHIDEQKCDLGGHFMHGIIKHVNRYCFTKGDCDQCIKPKDFPTPSSTYCLILTAHIDDISQMKLPQVLSQADESVSVRKIVIHFHKQHSPQSIGAIIDEYLTPRPWWRVVKEPYDWHGATSDLVVILDRYLVSWENHWRYLTSVQFPPSDICAQSSVLVGREALIHPGWYAVISFYIRGHHDNPLSIFSTFVPYLDNVKLQKSAFITITNPNNTRQQKDCPAFNHSDLTGQFSDTWRCAFLPTTNCSLPLKVFHINH